MVSLNRSSPPSTRLSSKGQVVIPKEVRDRLHLREGDELTVEETEDTIVLRITRKTHEALFGGPVPLEAVVGVLAGRRNVREPLTVEDMDRLAAAGAGARFNARSQKGP